MSQVHITSCVKQDLAQPDSASKIRSSNADTDWHSRLAKVLLWPFRQGWSAEKSRILKLPIIPLQDGSWVRAVDGEIFYDAVSGIRIPKDQGLRIVAPKLTKNQARRELFNSLGVKSAKTTMVRSQILEMYAESDMSSLSLESSFEHLEFLYLTHQSRPKGENLLTPYIHDHLSQPWRPREYDMHIHDDHPYGPQSLLGSRMMTSFNFTFVNSRYWENPPKAPSGMSMMWVEWMCKELWVERSIRLITDDETALSRECKHIAENHSDKFLELLRLT